jgi:hypothetical protein
MSRITQNTRSLTVVIFVGIVFSFVVTAAFLLSGCDSTGAGGGGGSSAKDGTFSASITGADSYNGKNFAVAIWEGFDPGEYPIASSVMEIAGGTALVTAQEDSEDWKGSGGSTYDALTFVRDTGVSGPPGDPGDRFYKRVPYSYKQDGNKSLPTVYEDYGGAVIVVIEDIDTAPPGSDPPYTFSAWLYTDGADATSDEADEVVAVGYSTLAEGDDEVGIFLKEHVGDFEAGDDLWFVVAGDYDLYLSAEDGNGDGWWTPSTGANFPININIPGTDTLVKTYTYNFDDDWEAY